MTVASNGRRLISWAISEFSGIFRLDTAALRHIIRRDRVERFHNLVSLHSIVKTITNSKVN